MNRAKTKQDLIRKAKGGKYPWGAFVAFILLVIMVAQEFYRLQSAGDAISRNVVVLVFGVFGLMITLMIFLFVTTSSRIDALVELLSDKD